MRGFGFNDTATAAGYLQGAVFGPLVPLLVTFYGAATGARMISAGYGSVFTRRRHQRRYGALERRIGEEQRPLRQSHLVLGGHEAVRRPRPWTISITSPT